MATVTHSIETTVAAEAIWEAWGDVARWPEWNGDIDHIELTGPFAVGSTITMTTRDGTTVELRLADVVEGQRFVDEADVAGTVVRTTHQIEPLGEDHVRVLYRLDAAGPAADELAPAISADFPQTIAALVEHAAR